MANVWADSRVGETLRYFAHAHDDKFTLEYSWRLMIGETASEKAVGESLEPLFAFSSDEGQIVTLPSLEKVATEIKSDAILATTPNKTQQSHIFATAPVKHTHPNVVEISSALFENGIGSHYDHQSVSPGAYMDIALEEFAWNKSSAWSTDQSLNADSGSSVGVQDVFPEPILGNGNLKEKTRTNKASKARRDRYKALVEKLKQDIEADPNIEPISMLPCLPEFIASDEKLCAKLMVRLQHHRLQLAQDQAVLFGPKGGA